MSSSLWFRPTFLALDPHPLYRPISTNSSSTSSHVHVFARMPSCPLQVGFTTSSRTSAPLSLSLKNNRKKKERKEKKGANNNNKKGKNKQRNRQHAQKGVAYAKPHITKSRLNYSFHYMQEPSD